MSIAIPTIAGASLGTAGSSTLSIGKPTGTALGDWLIGFIIDSANTVINPVESGWATDVTAAGIRGYRKKVDGTEGSSFGFTRASNLNNIAGFIVRVTGADSVSCVQPSGIAAQAGGSGTTVVLPTLNVTTGIDLLQMGLSLASTSFTPPSGPTELFDQQFATSNFAGFVGLERVAQGATGTRTWTAGASATRSGVMYALTPASGAGFLSIL